MPAPSLNRSWNLKHKLTPADWQLVNRIFDALLDCPAESHDQVALSMAGAREDIARQALSLIRIHRTDRSFLQKPAIHLGMMLTGTPGRPGVPDPFDPGTRIKGFRIISTIGQGGIARVYLAEEISLARNVALKVTLQAGDEARTMAGLDHQYIVPVYSEIFDDTTGSRLICMKYVEGVTLGQVIGHFRGLAQSSRPAASGATILEYIDSSIGHPPEYDAAAARDREKLAGLPYAEACVWISERLAHALDFTHAKDILHLDVKPANIILDRYGRPMLTDFNVSLSRAALSRSGLTGGTIQYMSPEQLEWFRRGADPATRPRIDQRADVYGLAKVVHELLHADGASTLTPLLDEVLARAMDPDPDQRPPSAGAFASCLNRAIRVFNINQDLKNIRPAPPLIRGWYPFWLVMIACLPQLFGSLVNITYNTLRIGPALSPDQQETFVDLILVYNMFMYPLGIWIVMRQVVFLSRAMRGKIRLPADAGRLVTIRRRVMASARHLLIASSIGWLPGALLFPWGIEQMSGQLPGSVYIHFLLSFVTSWLVALTYSFLLLEFVVIRQVYTRFLSPFFEFRDEVAAELQPARRRIGIARVLAGLIPLTGAVMMVFSGPTAAELSRYHVFQSATVALIALGMLGFVFALKLTDAMLQAIDRIVRSSA